MVRRICPLFEAHYWSVLAHVLDVRLHGSKQRIKQPGRRDYAGSVFDETLLIMHQRRLHQQLPCTGKTCWVCCPSARKQFRNRRVWRGLHWSCLLVSRTIWRYWIGQCNKKGYIHADVPAIFSKLNYSPEQWIESHQSTHPVATAGIRIGRAYPD